MKQPNAKISAAKRACQANPQVDIWGWGRALSGGAISINVVISHRMLKSIDVVFNRAAYE